MICTLFDKPWITGKRGKTDVAFQVPLVEIPKQILEKYKGTLPDNRLLPVARNRKENLSLREICKQCGINKRVTFHMARHTFATLTLSKGVSIESVSKMLGHTNIQTTQIYARITPQKIRDDMAVFAEKMEKNKSKLDQLFESLTIGKKLSLFHLPQTLSSDNNREKRLTSIWHCLSDEEKSLLWAKVFEEENNFVLENVYTEYKQAVNF